MPDRPITLDKLIEVMYHVCMAKLKEPTRKEIIKSHDLDEKAAIYFRNKAVTVSLSDLTWIANGLQNWLETTRPSRAHKAMINKLTDKVVSLYLKKR